MFYKNVKEYSKWYGQCKEIYHFHVKSKDYELMKHENKYNYSVENCNNN